jgi:SP family myo-inositol transporter-like MFS transporter 13
MLVTCNNWGPNIIVSSTFLSMMKGISPSGAFGFYAALSFLGWIAVIFCYPEAAGMTLEETRSLFTYGFGVKHANRLRKERRAAENKQHA